jgi:hypothetical protein
VLGECLKVLYGEIGQVLSLAVDGDAQCLSNERLVQQLVLSSRGLDVSGVKVTERSFGAVGAQGS